jgi:hypothetical protein
LIAATLAPWAAACRKADTETPVASATVSTSRSRAALGSPVDITYRFTLAEGARIPDDTRVFVHFVDQNDEQMWTDDHVPPVPPSQWKAGQTVEYTRTLFIPRYPFVGEATIKVGLYSPKTNRRLTMAGETEGQRAYRVGTLTILPNSESVAILFKEGWNPAEVARDNAGIEWQWTKADALASFRNPRKDAMLYLNVDGRPDLAGQPQQVTVSIGGQPLETFVVETMAPMLRRTPVKAAQFGDSEMVDLRIQVSPTFVPLKTPAAASNDPRELGIRVFNIFVEPTE